MANGFRFFLVSRVIEMLCNQTSIKIHSLYSNWCFLATFCFESIENKLSSWIFFLKTFLLLSMSGRCILPTKNVGAIWLSFFFYILIFESLKSKSSPFLLQFLFLKSNIKQFFFLFGWPNRFYASVHILLLLKGFPEGGFVNFAWKKSRLILLHWWKSYIMYMNLKPFATQAFI